MTNHLWKPKTPPKTGLSALRLFLAAKYLIFFQHFTLIGMNQNLLYLQQIFLFCAFSQKPNPPLTIPTLKRGGGRGPARSTVAQIIWGT